MDNSIPRKLLDIPTEEDSLARHRAAKAVAQTICQRSSECANVVAVTGGWGSGKSSFVRTVIAQSHLGNEDIRYFDPWMMGGEEALVASFFHTLLSFLPNLKNKRDRKERAAKFAHLVTAASGVGGLAGAGLALAGKGMESIWSNSLHDERKSLKKEFAKLDAVNVVVIDDIDRLDGAEIRTLFRAIKAIADFPNVSYLLMFDRLHVSKALGANDLEEDTKDRGEQYLDKVVGVMFDLPQFDADQREEMLRELAEEFLSGLEVEDRMASSRTGLVFQVVLLSALATVRQMKKFIRTASALVPTVTQDGSLEVDPADFLALEYIRQREPMLYAALVEEVMPIAGGALTIFNPDYDEEKVRHERRQAALPKQGARRDLCVEALECLGRDVASGGIDFSIENSASGFAEHRFACGYCTLAYFGFDTERAAMPESFWADIVSSLSSDQPLDFLFKQIKFDKGTKQLTRALADRIPRNMSVIESRKFFRRVMEWANDRPKDRDSVIGGPMGWPIVVNLLGTACLKNMSRSEATSFVAELVNAEEHTVPLARFVSHEVILRKESPGGGDWSASAGLERIVLALQLRLKEMIDDLSIYELPSPYDAIVAWNRMTPDGVRAEWRRKTSSEPRKLALYFNKFLGSLRSDDDGSWAVDKNDPLTDAIRDIDLSLLNDDGRWARQKHLSSADRNDRPQDDDSDRPSEDKLTGR